MAYKQSDSGIKEPTERDYKESPSISELWINAKQQIEERRKRCKPELPTGIDFIDDFTDGLHRGELWAIAGASGGGKTSLALQVCSNIAYLGKKVLVISLEMKGEELVARMFCNLKEYDNSMLKVGDYSDDFVNKDKDFTDLLKMMNMEIVEYGYNFDEVIKIIEGYYPENKPDLICVDFVQLIDWQQIGDERLAIQEYVRKLAELAKTKGIAILLVSQFRRPPTGADMNRPRDITDLRGCINGESIIGTRKIKNIVNTQKIKRVESFDRKSKKVVYKLPSRAVYSGVKKCYEITTNKGKKIILSSGTKLRTNKKWIESRNISEGDYIVCQK